MSLCILDIHNIKTEQSGLGQKHKDVHSIVTYDETWIYHYDPETKRQSADCVFPGEYFPLKAVQACGQGDGVFILRHARPHHVCSTGEST